MSNLNKYGLSREIPEPIKREIRQRCGFGCVNCGCAIYQYEHVEPLFSEAQEHNPDCMTLLCGGCHDRVTKKLLSKETIKLKMLNPKCKENGFSFGPFDLGIIPPEIVIGTLKCKNVTSLIKIYDDDIFTVCPPSSPDLPFLINARLCDKYGKEIFKIKDNEWQTPSSNWDVELVGQRITIRKRLKDILLILRSEPPHRLVIERMDMEHKGTKIRCQEGKKIEITTLSGTLMTASGGEIDKCNVGIKLDSSGLRIGAGGGGSVRFKDVTISSTPQITEHHKAPNYEKVPLIYGVYLKEVSMSNTQIPKFPINYDYIVATVVTRL